MPPPRVHAPTATPPAIAMLSRFLEARIAGGARFERDQFVQLAWSWLKVGTDHDGQPAILGPRAGAMPMDFVLDCSDALNLTLIQRYICDSFGVESELCDATQSAIVIKDIGSCRAVFMNRSDATRDRISGWFIGASDSTLEVNKPENLERKSLWEIACLLPFTRDFFLLPRGWQIVFKGRPVVLRDFQRADPFAGSYYAAKYGG